MPLYEFKCPDCGKTEEFFKKFENSDDPVFCQDCQVQMVKQVSGVVFKKGAGYWADYKSI